MYGFSLHPALLALWLGACQPEGGDPKDPDLDHDGYPASTDCDDEDPYSHPGAAEAWYDGVDQDCRGDDDYDADKDGFVPSAYVGLPTAGVPGSGGLPGGDCWDDPSEIPDGFEVVPPTSTDRSGRRLAWAQPTAVAVRPGASETWYDGVDQDCDGASDFDQDRDGHDSFAYPKASGLFGDDCLDGNPLDDPNPSGASPAEVHPGAEERWYDGTDDDCDGNDCDADGDGVPADPDSLASCADLDCDDTNPGVHPGAEEIWYDGVDQDCGDDDDWDADGDGWRPSEGDCDDHDPSRAAAFAEIWYDGVDQDCDGNDCDRDRDGFCVAGYAFGIPAGLGAGDCDDTNLSVHPGAVEIVGNDIDEDCDGGLACLVDRDRDGFVRDGEVLLSADADCDDEGEALEASTDPGDCDDDDARVHPAATEVVGSGRDENCDGREFCWVDDDDDGHLPASPRSRESEDLDCDDPFEGVRTDPRDDCDDALVDVHPGAVERCNGIDDDCDDEIDEEGAADGFPAWRDRDGDGFGDPGDLTLLCALVPGRVEDATDCDDRNGLVHPGAAELCDGLDDDCDGQVDEDDALDALLWYADADADGFGDPSLARFACEAPSGHVEDASDCDDGRAFVNPWGDELCAGESAGVDDDCDGAIDESDALDALPWYVDGDGDAWGAGAAVAFACEAPPLLVGRGGDCDDGVASVHPGATEILADGVDQDCDGHESCYADLDGDGFRPPGSVGLLSDDADCEDPGEALATAPGGDCDDTDGAVHPGAPEGPGDGVDQDCDGRENCLLDADGDGWRPEGGGTRLSEDLDCDDMGEAWSRAPAGDCDDAVAAVHPGAEERCNGVDDDCDGVTDGDTATDRLSWYRDADGDGFGDHAGLLLACERPAGHVADATDCDDTRVTVHPGAVETWYDGIDQDCDDNDCDRDLDGWDEDGARCGGRDCDDQEPAVHPGAEETCLDRQDNDCDGVVDSCDLPLSRAGLQLRGEARTDQAGIAVHGAGDLDGDGYDDLLVGAWYSDRGGSNSGAAYLVRGPRSGVLGLGSADAVFVGEAANDVAGTALASTDGDGDGRPEPVIAACNNDLAGTNAGTVYLGPAIPSGLLSLGASPAKLSGASAYDQAGWSVAGGFDANGDGREDLLVGAPYANPSSRSDAGEVFLVLAPFSGTMSLTDARARLQGGTSYDYAGWSVAAAGDPDGDGAPDLLVGAIGQDTGASMAGAVYLLPASLSGTVALSSATARLWGESAYDGAGVSLCGLGDQDGDGLDDLLVGAWQGASYGSSSGSGRGVVYVLNGPVDGAFSLALAEARILGRVDLDYAGFSVACPGDLDGDGRADLLLGAYGAATGALDGGLAALFVGPFEGSMDLGAAQVRAYATANEDDAGYSVSGSGDFDGDGIPDLLVGAIREDSAATNAGAAYVLFGQELVSSW